MPELPDVTVYVERIAERVCGQRLAHVRLMSPFVLRTAVPPIALLAGRRAERVSRLGKRIVLHFEGELFLVVHLMIAGRFRWLAAGATGPKKLALAALDFAPGTLLLTEASKKRRASLHLVQGAAGLAELDPGGLELDGATCEQFVEAMTRERHTLKRALTDPTILSGIGNAYSDEILRHARLSPLRLTDQLDAAQWTRLFDACRAVLGEWTGRLRRESEDSFPERVTAFREGMAVHGRHRQPCPRCGTPVQRIVHAEHETNYCPSCQTGGKLLADRALSRLLRADWPRSLEELEARKTARRAEHLPSPSAAADAAPAAARPPARVRSRRPSR